jgi:hypothetical protein
MCPLQLQLQLARKSTKRCKANMMNCFEMTTLLGWTARERERFVMMMKSIQIVVQFSIFLIIYVFFIFVCFCLLGTMSDDDVYDKPLPPLPNSSGNSSLNSTNSIRTRKFEFENEFD